MSLRKSKRFYGNLGEEFAIKLLTNKRYKLIARNFQSRYGEIDIIAQDGNTLVFIEVKTRWSMKYGAPEESVTKSKLNKIRITGEYFSLTHPHLPKKVRIDVVAIVIQDGKLDSAKIITVF
jgi:putative endonuclease